MLEWPCKENIQMKNLKKKEKKKTQISNYNQKNYCKSWNKYIELRKTLYVYAVTSLVSLSSHQSFIQEVYKEDYPLLKNARNWNAPHRGENSYIRLQVYGMHCS